jgi:aminoglycoside phosphotransferase (APT) family kinase protein
MGNGIRDDTVSRFSYPVSHFPPMDITSQIHSYLTTAPTSNFLQQEVQMVDHWSGRDNLLWRVECRGQEAVLKLFLDAGQARSRRQFDGQQIFAPLGVAPRPLWVDRYPEGLARQILVYEWLPGAMLDPVHPTHLAALAHSVARIHSSDASAVRRFCPNPLNLDYLWRVLGGSIGPIQHWLADQAASALREHFKLLSSNARALVEAALPLWASAPPSAVHGDLKLENCIDSFGAVILLDWEMFGLGDPALEVATFLQLSQDVLDTDAQATWLEHYLDGVDQPGLAQRIAVYQHILPFQAVCYLLDGLRQQTAAEAATVRANLPFLKATLMATLNQAATALQIEGDDMSEHVETLLGSIR